MYVPLIWCVNYVCVAGDIYSTVYVFQKLKERSPIKEEVFTADNSEYTPVPLVKPSIITLPETTIIKEEPGIKKEEEVNTRRSRRILKEVSSMGCSYRLISLHYLTFVLYRTKFRQLNAPKLHIELSILPCDLGCKVWASEF